MCRWWLFLCLGMAACGAATGGAAPDVPLSPDALPETSCLPSVWVPGDFDYQTRVPVKVEVSLVYPDGSPRPSVVVHVLSDSPDPSQYEDLAVGLTGPDGRFATVVPVRDGSLALTVLASFMGANNLAEVPVVSGVASVELGRE